MSNTRTVAVDGSYWADQMAAVSRQRDKSSFIRIYDHFAPRVRLYLKGLGVSGEIADELAQEALLKLWQRAELYDPSRSVLSTWLFRIARNLHIDRVRKEPQWVFVQDELDGLDHLEDTGSLRPEQFAEHAQLESRIDQLSTIQARLVRMSYLEAKTHREIAVELGMPLGTVKSHLRRAFQQLQQDLRGGA